MAVATIGPERLAANFTLHRSETVAHSARLLDRKNSAASSRARGRSEGFACKHSDAFKPLGAPITIERITELHTTTLGKVAKIEAAVKGEANTVHQDKKEKERSRRLEIQKMKEFQDKVERPTSPDAKDVANEQAAEEASLEAEREMLSLSRLPHALYGKDLPRCGQAQERQEKDGFNHLKLHIQESFRRVGQVKSDADAAFEARKDHLQLMLPSPRSRDASPEKTSAFLTSVDLPHSAREHRPKPRRPSIQLQPKTWLPSLAEYLALDGAPMERDTRTDHGRHKDLIKEIVQELIPLPKGPKPNWIEEGRSQGKSRWVSRRKALEKELNDSWKDKAFYKRCTPFIPQRDAEEYRRQYHDDEHKLATIERFLKDLGVTEELKEKNVVEERTVNPAEIAAGVGSMSPDQAFAVLQEKRREEEVKGRNERAEPGYMVDARARSRAIHQKARAQLREPEDPSSSSLAVLRTAVYDYQAMRDSARQKLQDTLENQEKTRMHDRLPPLRHDSRIPREEPADQRHHWYRSLLEQVRAQGDAVPKATHGLLDSVKAVLEQGGDFGADDFWACATQIEEVTPLLASLLMSMCRHLKLNGQALLRVLQKRGDLPQEVLEVLNG